MFFFSLGFMGATEFLRLVHKKNKFVELCGAGAVHNHAKSNGKPVYYGDVIIKASNA